MTADGTEATEAESAMILLTNALRGANMREIFPTKTATNWLPVCYNSRGCHVPQDQWKTEVRYWFETTLARIQLNVLDVVRGNTGDPEDYAGIPPRYRGLCAMEKFKSVGWRNVSTWGLLGLLIFAAGVSVASVRTEEQVLWLVVGARLLIRTMHWFVHQVREPLWKSVHA